MIIIEPIDEKRFRIKFKYFGLAPQGTTTKKGRTINFRKLPNITASSYRYKLSVEANP